MSTALLHTAYDGLLFKEHGDHLIQILSEHLLTTTLGATKKTIEWNEPSKEYEFWKKYLDEQPSTEAFFKTVLARSIHTHQPKYIGHQVAPTVPVSALATLLSAQLNNGMAVYEMGAASSAIERLVIEFFNRTLDWIHGDGFLTSGGTLANLTALLAARKAKATTNVWKEGHTQKLAIMVSEQAHYCVDRAARIMGLGEDGIIKVPVNSNFALDSTQLTEQYERATKNGYQVIALIGSAPSTATGTYDNLDQLASFAKSHNLWFHVDGAHGGAAIFSNKYKTLVQGIERADSIIIDGHKMMGAAAITTAVLFKNASDSYTTFQQEASYLWADSEDPEWYNYGKRTFECTKSMMCLRIIAILNAHGAQFFDDFVTTLYNAAYTFGKIIDSHPAFELALQPESNIVCFRYIKGVSEENKNSTNQKIRKELLEEGEFYIVATNLKSNYWLRTTFMNPFTNEKHMRELLQKIEVIAAQSI